MHAIDGLILEEKLVVFGYGDKEKNGGDVFEAVDPLLSLGALTSHIEHAVGQLANNKCGLSDASGLDTRSEDVLVIREIVRLGNPANRLEITKTYILVYIGVQKHKQKWW